jgi:hypothetical protein
VRRSTVGCAEFLVQRVADERVREPEPVDYRRLAEHAGGHRLVECLQNGILVDAAHSGELPDAELAAQP